MTVESAALPADLNVAFPQHTDQFSEADGHLRLIKSVLKTTFPNLAAALTATAASLNRAGSAFIGAITAIPSRSTTLSAQLDLMPSSSSGRVSFVNTGVPAAVGGLAITISDAADLNPLVAAVMTRAGDFATSSSVGAPNVNGTTGVLQAGVRLVPAGVIVMWFGSVATIPAGWVLCDGTNGTPDLRSRFVKGAGTITPLTTGGTAPATALTSTAGGGQTVTSVSAGAHAHTGATGGYALLAADIPAHTHTATVTDPGHQHVNASLLPVSTPGSGIAGAGTGYTFTGAPSATTGITVSNSSIGGGGSHAHSISSDGAHTHDVTVASHTHTTASVDPLFTALCFIMKT